MVERRALYALWAKTGRGKEHGDAYHPLICHLIDVAEVAGAMWNGVLTPALRQRVTIGLGIVDEVTAGQWVAYLAGLHDIGKASPVFQQKAEGCHDRLRQAGISWERNPDDPGHGTISAYAIKALLPEYHGVPQPVANDLATAIGGHHGAFPIGDKVEKMVGSLTGGNEQWVAMRRDLAGTLAELLGVAQESGPQRIDHATAMILAGLVSVVDWIGSDEGYFEYNGAEADAGTLDLDAYRKRAATRARQALEELGWLGWTPSDTFLSFTELFPNLPGEPRPVQLKVGELPGVADGPGIVIIELPMGEGKTEAAFYLADIWGVELKQRGAYVAMPTMATSNQMFGRLRELLERRYPGSTLNLQLLHSQAAISHELEAAASADAPVIEPGQVWDGDGLRSPARVLAAEWFTRRKRGLLAPFGVGTVDQSLLAALQTRHVFVRLFGLAGKTVIFDEVHAYDTYMSTLFERLLEWLGALGTSVVILSATLPRERRDALVQKYAKWSGGPTVDEVPYAAYPRLTWYTPAGVGAEHVAASEDSHRELRIEWVDGDLASLGERLQSVLTPEHGGCAAVICNTVRQAQETYRALKAFFPDEGELDLLHARYPFDERAKREQRALVRFGKPGGKVPVEGRDPVDVERPHRAVLVATQVIEQSLDLDFDLMVTQLAPVDLVLQRSGRLHRHPGRLRPDRLKEPVLWILRPDRVENDVPRFDRGTEIIYDEHVLLRSWLELSQRETIAIPGEIECLIEEVYRDREFPETAGEAVRARWEKTLADMQKDAEKEREQALTKYIRSPTRKVALEKVTRGDLEDDAPELHQAHQALTRLIQPTAPVICLFETDRGIALDQQGEHVVHLKATPSQAEARRLLARAVGISDRRVVFSLLDRQLPAGWQGSALLRHHRELIFNSDGIAELNGHLVRLDPELGIRIDDTDLDVEREEG